MSLHDLLPALRPVVDEFERRGIEYYIAYLAEWAARLNVFDLWERIRGEAAAGRGS